MALTMTYEVLSLKVRNQTNADGVTLTDVIVQTHWNAKGVDEDGNTATFFGGTPFTAESVGAADFVPFADLTEEMVMGWITGYINSMPGYLDHIKERIMSQIEELTGVEREEHLPWNPTAPLLHGDPATEGDQPDPDPAPAEPGEDEVGPDPDATAEPG